jgi:hypothetical protein
MLQLKLFCYRRDVQENSKMAGRKEGCFLHFLVYSSLTQIEAVLFLKTSSVLYQNKRRFLFQNTALLRHLHYSGLLPLNQRILVMLQPFQLHFASEDIRWHSIVFPCIVKSYPSDDGIREYNQNATNVLIFDTNVPQKTPINYDGSYINIGARGSIVVKALCYKPECRGFDTRWGEFLNLPNPSGRTRPWGLLNL